MTNILLSSAVTGVATLASAFVLQKLYEKTNFYPPNPVFWFFIGVTAHAGIVLGNRLLSAAQLPALPSGLAGFGETAEELDKLIATYQEHIAKLNKVLAGGSPAGKEKARQKIEEEQGILDKLLKKKEG